MKYNELDDKINDETVSVEIAAIIIGLSIGNLMIILPLYYAISLFTPPWLCTVFTIIVELLLVTKILGLVIIFTVIVELLLVIKCWDIMKYTDIDEKINDEHLVL